MGININRNLPGNAYDAATTANTPSGTNPYATLADIPQVTSNGGTQLLTGAASWSGTGMTFDVTDLTYIINGINYSSSATAVTLATGDPSDPRFDAIVADDTGAVSVVTGTPSANPLTPTIGTNEVLVQYVLVSAGATTPTITNAFVYRNDAVSDWAGFVAGAAPAPTANFSSPTPTPFEGTNCLLASYGTYSTGRYVGFTAPSPISRANYAILSLRVYLPQNFATLDGVPQGRKPFVQLVSGTTSLGIRYLDQHGLNLSLTGVWQLVNIPLAFFGAAPNLGTITSLRLFLVEYINTTPAYVDIAYDDIKFQTGYGPQTNTATIDVLDNGVVVGSTAKINIIDSTGINVTPINDTTNNKIDLILNATGVVEPFYATGGVTLADYNNPVFVIMDSSGGADLTIPNNSVVPLPIGYTVRVTNIGTLNTGIIAAPGVTYYAKGGATQINGQYGVITLTKINTDEWIIDGDLI